MIEDILKEMLIKKEVMLTDPEITPELIRKEMSHLYQRKFWLIPRSGNRFELTNGLETFKIGVNYEGDL